jgi:hypothetical protein
LIIKTLLHQKASGRTEGTLKELNEIAEDKDTYKTLGKFVHLAYQTTGAGYYTKNYLKTQETKK